MADAEIWDVWYVCPSNLGGARSVYSRGEMTKAQAEFRAKTLTKTTLTESHREAGSRYEARPRPPKARETGSWGQERGQSMLATAGTTAAIQRAREALRDVGVHGDTLAEQAEKAADILSLVKAMADAD